MTDRPILFSAPMIRALLEGRKTQTRRVLKLPERVTRRDVPDQLVTVTNKHIEFRGPRTEEGSSMGFTFIRSPYLIGDRLWVRETYCPIDDSEYGGDHWIDYRATPRYSDAAPGGWDEDPDNALAAKWKPSIHMPRSASRLTLLVTEVRVQRLQDISNDDIIAEGVGHPIGTKLRYGSVTEAWNRDREWIPLWDSINQKRGFGWDVNPWVVALTFDVIEKNIDEVKGERE